MASTGPTDGDPFSGFLGDLMRLIQSSGGAGGWDAARQLAIQVATGGQPEANPEPLHRIRLEALVGAAEPRVADATGLSTTRSGRAVRIVPVTRSEWAQRTLQAYQPLLERLAASISGSVASAATQDDDPDGSDPTSRLLGDMLSAMAPMLLTMQAGSMVGHLAARAIGPYDLPLPRPDDELLVVDANITRFEEEWSLPGDDVRLWICLSELTTHAVLALDHVRARFGQLLDAHADAYRIDPAALEGQLASVELTDPAALQAALGDPITLLAALQSPAQRQLRPQLDALVAALVGYVDHVVDVTGGPLIPTYPMLSEALRRRRVEASPADRVVELLLGLDVGVAAYERGAAFVEGVLTRSDEATLARLWNSARELPTPAEVDAPGLWLARIDLD